MFHAAVCRAAVPRPGSAGRGGVGPDSVGPDHVGGVDGVPRGGGCRIGQVDHRRGRGLHRVALAGWASGEELGGVLIARIDPAAVGGGEVRVGAGDVVEDGAGGDARVVGAQAPQRELGVGMVDGGFVARPPVPRGPDTGMGNLTRHADLGGAVGEVRGEEVPVRSDHTRGPVVSVVEEGETAGVPHGRPDEPGGRRAEGHQAGLAERRLPPAGRGRRHRGTPRRSRRGPPRGDIRNRQSVHPAYQSPTAGSCCCSPCRHSPDAHKRYSRDRSSAGTTRSASPLRAGLWSASLCSTAHPSATTSRRRVPGPPRVPVVAVAHDPAHRGAVGHARRNHPRGRASSRTRACSAAACSTAEVTTSVAAGPASSSEVAEPRPQGPCAALAG